MLMTYDGEPVLATQPGQCQACGARVLRVLTGDARDGEWRRRVWHAVDDDKGRWRRHKCRVPPQHGPGFLPAA